MCMHIIFKFHELHKILTKTIDLWLSFLELDREIYMASIIIDLRIFLKILTKILLFLFIHNHSKQIHGSTISDLYYYITIQ